MAIIKNFSYTQPASPELKQFPMIRMLCHNKWKKADTLLPHLNDGIEICCTTKGEYVWNVEGRTESIRKDEFSITLPWQKHGGDENIISKGELLWCIIRPESFSRNGTLNLGSWSRIPTGLQKEIGNAFKRNKNINVGKITGLLTLFIELADEIIRKLKGFHVRVYALIDEIILKVFRHMQDSLTKVKTVPDGMREAIGAVEQNISRNWTLPELQKIGGLQGTAFIEWFKRITGFSPKHYLIYLRINRAKELLCSGEKQVTEIAMELNFVSSQHFANTFKKWTKMTPREYFVKKA